jgi:hypothetical protein
MIEIGGDQISWSSASSESAASCAETISFMRLAASV